jgi:hypothetical protein
VRTIPQLFRIEEQGRAVEVAVGAIEVAGADGELVRVDLVTQANGLVARGDSKRALVDAGDRKRLVMKADRGELLHVAGVLADEIAAGGPDREGDREGVSARRKVRLDLEQVRVRPGH